MQTAEQTTLATKKRTSRGIAQLLALIGPWGIGHFALGQTKRALLWFFVPLVLIAAGFLARLQRKAEASSHALAVRSQRRSCRLG
jgi:fatty acid desaturase